MILEVIWAPKISSLYVDPSCQNVSGTKTTWRSILLIVVPHGIHLLHGARCVGA